MDTNAMDLYGQALRDFLAGDHTAKVTVHRDDGYVSDLWIGKFFREPADFSPLEQAALHLCRGDVLDIGAGAGCHSLALQEQGRSVAAVDISPCAVEVMAKRGVRNVRCMDVFDPPAGQFDTLLMLMHGIGMVGSLAGLDRFLRHAHRWLEPEGQLLCDSLDVRGTEDPIHLAYQEANRRAGRPCGEIRMQFEYRGQTAPYFSWLHVEAETLAGHAERMGWSCRVIYREESGDYLAQLAPSPAVFGDK